MEIVIIALVVVLPVAFLTAEVDIFRHPKEAFRAVGRTRGGTAALVFFGYGIGGLYWFLAIRGPVSRAGRRVHRPDPVREDPWADDALAR